MPLVLTRKENESIILMREGEPDIKVTVVGMAVSGRSIACRLAITAPDSVDVVREELLYRGESWRGIKNGRKPVRD